MTQQRRLIDLDIVDHVDVEVDVRDAGMIFCRVEAVVTAVFGRSWTGAFGCFESSSSFESSPFSSSSAPSASVIIVVPAKLLSFSMIES